MGLHQSNMSEENTDVVVVLEFKPEIFDPKKETLLAIAEEVSKITADPSKMTKDDLELINTTKNKLVKARTSIAKAGKAARAAATQYNRDVKAYEDELIAILEPEELRLKKLETDAKEYAIRQERLKILPEYIQKLTSIGDNIEVTDDELLSMDPTAFQAYYNARLGAHLQLQKAEADAKAEADRIAHEAEQKRIDDANAEAERKIRDANLAIYNSRVQQLLQLGLRDEGPAYTFTDPANPEFKFYNFGKTALQEFSGDWQAEISKIESVVSEAKSKIEQAAKEANDLKIQEAAQKAKEEAEAKAKREADELEAKRQADAQAVEDDRLAKEAKEAEEKAAREANEMFQNWLAQFDYSDATHLIVEKDGKSLLYKFIDEYHHNN
jgi:hypothetical protein